MKSGKIRDSIVEQSISAARRIVALTFVMSVVLVGLFIGKNVLVEKWIVDAADRGNRAAVLLGQILTADERLTLFAHVAAVTGEQRWIDRYEANIPLIESAISEAKKIAPPEIALRFDNETRTANDLLVDMEHRSFALVRKNRLNEARAILDSPAYATQKEILSLGSNRFSTALLASTARNLRLARLNAHLLTAGLVLLCGLGFLLLWRNLTFSLQRSRNEFIQAEQRIHKLALFNSLTGLPNRQHFDEALEGILRADSARNKTAVIMLDLDRFKPINDRYGHGIGDKVLAGIGRRLDDALQPGEIGARLGGDEFAVAVPIQSDGEVRLAAERIVNAIATSIDTEGLRLSVGASAGIAIHPDHGTHAEELMRKADVALYRAKRNKRGAIRRFEVLMDDEVHDRAQAEAELREAIAGGQIIPYFQPVVNLATGRIEGFRGARSLAASRKRYSKPA